MKLLMVFATGVVAGGATVIGLLLRASAAESGTQRELREAAQRQHGRWLDDELVAKSN